MADTPTGKAERQRRPFRLGRVLNAWPVAVLIYALIVAGFAYAAYTGAQALGYNWQWARVPRYIYQFTDNGFQPGELLYGLGATIVLSSISFVFATLVGLLIALLRLSDLVVGRAVANVFLEVVRNSPLLVLLYLCYYVLGPVLGLDRYIASIFCLAIFHGALISEIFRAGIQAVPKGQWEAAKSIGMSGFQEYRYIVIPQSIRFVLPPLTSEVVHLIKSSSIVSVIAVVELTTVGRNIISATYMSFEIWFTVAAIYLCLTLSITVFVTIFERRLQE